MKTQERYSSDIGTVTFRLKKADSNGLCSILGTYLFKEYQIGFSTEIKIQKEQWDSVAKQIISGKQKKENNDKLNRFRTIIAKWGYLIGGIPILIVVLLSLSILGIFLFGLFYTPFFYKDNLELDLGILVLKDWFIRFLIIILDVLILISLLIYINKFIRAIARKTKGKDKS